MFSWKSHAGLKFHFGQIDRCEIHTVLSFISPHFMWTQVNSWLNTEVRFSTEMKSYTGLSSFLLSCQHNLTVYMENSLRSEISLWPIWPKWTLHQSEFHYARSHVNADNEVTSHQSEILPRSEISNRFEFTSGLM